MRIKVTKEQFYLLLANFDILGNKKLALQMNGNVYNRIVENKRRFGELFSVKLLFDSQYVEIDLVTSNSASAMTIIRKMYPNCRIIGIKKRAK